MWPNPEVKLLCYCIRPQKEAAIAEQIQLLLQKPLEWQKLVKIAEKQGVIPLFYRNIQKICPEAVPQEIGNELQNTFKNNARRNLFLSLQLVKLLKLFEAHHISAIPYKGPVLAASAYQNLALRQFNDLDLLVPRQELKKAKELLIAQGYKLTSELFWENEFIDEQNGISVDLHREITPKFFSFSTDFDQLWECREPISLAGVTVSNFSAEDSLLILCVYLARDCWQRHERLIQICDIAYLVDSHPEIKWEKLLELATTLGSRRMLFLGLLLAEELLGTRLPDHIWQKIQQEPTVKSLAKQVCEWLFSDHETAYLGLERKLFYVRVRERFQDIIPHFPYLLRYWVTPTQTDRDFCYLPESLSWLYYVVRQVRLLGQYGGKFIQRLLN